MRIPHHYVTAVAKCLPFLVMTGDVKQEESQKKDNIKDGVSIAVRTRETIHAGHTGPPNRRGFSWTSAILHDTNSERLGTILRSCLDDVFAQLS